MTDRVPLERTEAESAEEAAFVSLYGPWSPMEPAEFARVADDGIRYLLPEIVLTYKARLHRAKDDPDFEAALPLLDARRHAWLGEALEVVAPDHHWIDRLRPGT